MDYFFHSPQNCSVFSCIQRMCHSVLWLMCFTLSIATSAVDTFPNVLYQWNNVPILYHPTSSLQRNWFSISPVSTIYNLILKRRLVNQLLAAQSLDAEDVWDEEFNLLLEVKEVDPFIPTNTKGFIPKHGREHPNEHIRSNVPVKSKKMPGDPGHFLPFPGKNKYAAVSPAAFKLENKQTTRFVPWARIVVIHSGLAGSPRTEESELLHPQSQDALTLPLSLVEAQGVPEAPAEKYSPAHDVHEDTSSENMKVGHPAVIEFVDSKVSVESDTGSLGTKDTLAKKMDLPDVPVEKGSSERTNSTHPVLINLPSSLVEAEGVPEKPVGKNHPAPDVHKDASSEKIKAGHPAMIEFVDSKVNVESDSSSLGIKDTLAKKIDLQDVPVEKASSESTNWTHPVLINPEVVGSMNKESDLSPLGNNNATEGNSSLPYDYPVEKPAENNHFTNPGQEVSLMDISDRTVGLHLDHQSRKELECERRHGPGWVPFGETCVEIHMQCGEKRWIVCNPASRKFECRRMPCANSDYSQLKNGTCVKIADLATMKVCAENQKMFKDRYGQISCECKDLHAFWEPHGKCYPLYQRGPCEAGEVLGLSADKRLSCLPNICDSNAGVVFDAACGCCYKLGTKGPCARNLIFSLDRKTLEPVCINSAKPTEFLNSAFTCALGSIRAWKNVCLKNLTIFGDVCQEQNPGELYNAEKMCKIPLLEKEPCENAGTWRILDLRTSQPTCVEEPCSPSECLIAESGICEDCKRFGEQCQKKGFRGVLTVHGTAMCDCADSTAYSIFANKCFQLHTRGPCGKDEIFVYTYNETFAPSEFDNGMRCEKNICGYERSVVWSNGQCYTLDSQGPCQPLEKLLINPQTLRPECLRIKEEEPNAHSIFGGLTSFLGCSSFSMRDFGGKCLGGLSSVQRAFRHLGNCGFRSIFGLCPPSPHF